MSRPARRLLLAALFAAPLLSACGFRLQGPQAMAFSSIHLGMNPHDGMGAQLARQIAASGSTTVVDDPNAAEVRLQVLSDRFDREILSLTGAGKVREYELTREFVFQLQARDGSLLIPPTRLSARRDYTFQDERILAKEQEESLLVNDMQQEMVRQIVRRLAAVQR